MQAGLVLAIVLVLLLTPTACLQGHSKGPPPNSQKLREEDSQPDEPQLPEEAEAAVKTVESKEEVEGDLPFEWHIYFLLIMAGTVLGMKVLSTWEQRIGKRQVEPLRPGQDELIESDEDVASPLKGQQP